MRFSRKSVAVAAAIVVSVVLGTAAYAYWTTSGTGTGSATAGTSTAVTVTQVGTTAGLYPGGPALPVNFKITNSTPGNQYVASVALSITGVTPTTCPVGDFVLVQPTAIAADLIPGETTFSPSGASIALLNTAVNQDACKLAVIALAFAAS